MRLKDAKPHHPPRRKTTSPEAKYKTARHIVYAPKYYAGGIKFIDNTL